jgi:hypothetical protein
MVPQPQASPLNAGSVLPIKRAEELLQTLPGVMAVRIIASETGAVDEIHVLTSAEVTPKQTVRNIESALIAHLGMRVDHRKISVATSLEARKRPDQSESPLMEPVARSAPVAPVAPAYVPPVAAAMVPPPAPAIPPHALVETAGMSAGDWGGRRSLYFEDVQIGRSRAKGITCRVTLAKGDKSYVGEAEGHETERSRIELAARAALRAIADAEPGLRPLDLGGARLIDAFERAFVFVGVTAVLPRASAMLTGSCEVKDSPEIASVLAVLDATNRWLLQPREAAR